MIRRVILSGVVTAAHAFGATLACEPTVTIGHFFCPNPVAESNTPPDPGTPVPAPWTTGFESGFCDYAPPLGFCVTSGNGSLSIVTSPVHSGRYAAAFSVRGDGDGGQGQARCVLQGVFPSTAYYGAWYYVPAPAVNNHLWNLFHFRGGDAGAELDGAVGGGPMPHGLWDLSLVNLDDAGATRAILFDFQHGVPDARAVIPIPIGQWFHLEVYFKRANDPTGEITMWQDGVVIADLSGVATDDTDWGQWFVGNLADALLPPASTVYVDDVTIGLAP